MFTGFPSSFKLSNLHLEQRAARTAMPWYGEGVAGTLVCRASLSLSPQAPV